MNHDQLLKDYEFLVEDLSESGLSLGEIKQILVIKEQIKKTVRTYQYRLQIPIKCKHEWEETVFKSSQGDIDKLYTTLGFDTNYKVVLDYCRIDGKYTWCLVGSERFDKKWLASGKVSDGLFELMKDMRNPMRRQAGQSMQDTSRLKLAK